MIKISVLKQLRLIIRLILGLIVIFAGIAKAFHPVQFAFQLRYDYGLAMFPASLFSAILPFIEIGIGLILLSARFALIATRGVQILFASFIAFHA